MKRAINAYNLWNNLCIRFGTWKIRRLNQLNSTNFIWVDPSIKFDRSGAWVDPNEIRRIQLIQTSNLPCVDIQWFDSTHGRFDVWTGPYIAVVLILFPTVFNQIWQFLFGTLRIGTLQRKPVQGVINSGKQSDISTCVSSNCIDFSGQCENILMRYITSPDFEDFNDSANCNLNFRWAPQWFRDSLMTVCMKWKPSDSWNICRV